MKLTKPAKATKLSPRPNILISLITANCNDDGRRRSRRRVSINDYPNRPPESARLLFRHRMVFLTRGAGGLEGQRGSRRESREIRLDSGPTARSNGPWHLSDIYGDAIIFRSAALSRLSLDSAKPDYYDPREGEEDPSSANCRPNRYRCWGRRFVTRRLRD